MVLEDALQKAWEDIRGRDHKVIAAAAGIQPPDANGRIRVPFLGRDLFVLPSEAKVLEEDDEPARPEQALLVLHYLLGVREGEPKGKLISFRELEGGAIYYTAFEARSIKRLVEAFGNKLHLLEKAALSIGGRHAPMGDISVVIDVLPKVPITIAMWRGDEEIAPSTNVLLDDTIRSYLQTEDVAVLCGFLVGELIRRAFRR
jgi:hypothetical protein